MQLNECINFMLSRVQNSVFSYFKNQLSPYDITPAQYSILKCLWDNGEQVPTQLSQFLFLDNSTISSILARMENKGLVERIHSEIDRRSVTVRIKPEGEKLKADIELVIHQANTQILAAFDESEKAILRQYISRITEQIDCINKGEPTK